MHVHTHTHPQPHSRRTRACGQFGADVMLGGLQSMVRVASAYAKLNMRQEVCYVRAKLAIDMHGSRLLYRMLYCLDWPEKTDGAPRLLEAMAAWPDTIRGDSDVCSSPLFLKHTKPID